MGKASKQRSRLGLLMKIAIGVSVFFFLAIGGLHVYGTTVPEVHEATGSRTIDAPVGEVFTLVADPRKGLEWRENVAEVKHYEDHGEGLARWTEVWKDGNSFNFAITEHARDERLKITINDVHGHFSGSWTYEFKPDSGRTIVAITERGHIPNPLIRAMHNLTADPAGPLTKNLVELESHFAR